MFSAIRDFFVGTATQPFVDGANWSWTLGWAGAVIGGIATLATGNAGFLLMGVVGGGVGGGLLGAAVGLLTGGVRNIGNGLAEEESVRRQDTPEPTPTVEVPTRETEEVRAMADAVVEQTETPITPVVDEDVIALARRANELAAAQAEERGR